MYVARKWKVQDIKTDKTDHTIKNSSNTELINGKNLPSLEYVNSPNVKWYQELKEKRLKDKLAYFKMKYDKDHKNNEIWKFNSKIWEQPNSPKLKNKEKLLEPILKTYTKQKIKDEVTEKICKTIVFPNYKDKSYFSPNSNKPNINYKWSTIEDKFRWSLKHRMLDEFQNIEPSSTDFLPMFSSFSKDSRLNIKELPPRKIDEKSTIKESLSSSIKK